MNFVSFIENLAMLRNYEATYGSVNIVVLTRNRNIIYEKYKIDNGFDFQKATRVSLNGNTYYIGTDGGHYYICYPLTVKNDLYYKNNGYIFTMDLTSKEAADSFLLVSEVLAMIMGNSVDLEHLEISDTINTPRFKEIHITPRELEVIHLISRGHTDDEIVANLLISKPTLRACIKNLFIKAGTSNRAGLICFFYKCQLERVHEKTTNVSFGAV